MRHQDLRRPRRIENLWLRLRLAVSIHFPPRLRSGDDPRQLSDHLLRDLGLERPDGRREAAVRPVRMEDGLEWPALRRPWP
jgi:uncharacterized protein YjiS (DUF1127 family)